MENNDKIISIKNKMEHNDEILREIQHRIMVEIWYIIPISLQLVPSRVKLPGKM